MKTYILLGRTGDQLALLPALYHEHQKTGEKIGLVVSKEFSQSIEACSYIEPVILDIDFRRIDLAGKMVAGSVPSQVVGKKAIISQVYGLKYRTKILLDSFIKESWRLAGFDGLWRENPPLVFDKRNKKRELLLSLTINPYNEKNVLVFTGGHSSPFPHERLLMDLVESQFPKHLIIKNPQAEKIHDLVALMENADMIFATDSAPLHLTQACQQIPVVALIADTPSMWHGSPLRKNHIAYSRYSSFPQDIPFIKDAINQAGRSKEVVHVYSDYPMSGDALRRYDVAKATWHDYRLGITNSYFARSLNGCPYVKDMLRQACQVLEDDAVIMLHNSDTGFYKDTADRAVEAVRTHGSCFAYRDDYQGQERVITAQETGYEKYLGSDLFCFTKKWWRENNQWFPDLVLGFECWDRIMRTLIQHKGGAELPDAIFHFRHPTRWEAERLENKANIHNRKLARRWLRERKLPLEEIGFTERY